MPFFAKSSTILGACALTTSLVPNYSVVTVNAGRNGGNGKRAKEGERQFQTMEQLMKIIDYEFPEVKYGRGKEEELLAYLDCPYKKPKCPERHVPFKGFKWATHLPNGLHDLIDHARMNPEKLGLELKMNVRRYLENAQALYDAYDTVMFMEQQIGPGHAMDEQGAEIFKHLHENRDPYYILNYEQPHERMSPLIRAVAAGNAEVVNFLLEQPGINKGSATREGHNALHLAASLGHTQVVLTLMHHGFDPIDQSMVDGAYPIHRACVGPESKHTETVSAFIEEGQVPLDISYMENGKRLTCMMLAEARQNKLMIAMLEGFKKNPPLSPARKKKLEAKKKKQAEKEAAERLRLAEENGTVAELEEQEGVFRDEWNQPVDKDGNIYAQKLLDELMGGGKGSGGKGKKKGKKGAKKKGKKVAAKTKKTEEVLPESISPEVDEIMARLTNGVMPRAKTPDGAASPADVEL